MNLSSKINNLTEGSVYKTLLTIALPILLTSISQMAYNLIDIFWIGKVDNIGLDESYSISAVGSASMIMWFTMGFILIAKIGTSVKVSHYVGQKDHQKMSIYASNGLIMQFLFGVVISVIIFIFRYQILQVFDMENETTYQYAVSYLSIVGSLVIFQFMASGFSSINEGLGKTSINLKVLSTGLILNIILDPLFILYFKMGIQGAAIATVIAQAFTLLVFIIYYFKNNRDLHQLSLKAWDWDAMKGIVKVGIPTGLQSLLFTSISIYISRLVFTFGDEAMSAQRIGVQIEQFTWMIGGGFQSALTVYVGQNFGANKADRIKSGLKAVFKMLIPYSIVISLLLALLPRFIIGIFANDPLIVSYGANYLRIVSLSQVFMTVEAIGTGVFIGIGKTVLPSISGIFNNLLRIPLAYLFMIPLGQNGIWWALNTSAILKGIVMGIGLIILIPRMQKYIDSYLKYHQLKQVEI